MNFNQFQSNPFIQYGSTGHSRAQPHSVATSRYHPYQKHEHIFNSKCANPVPISSQYQPVLARHAQKQNAAENAQAHVSLAGTLTNPPHVTCWQLQPQSQTHSSTRPSQGSLQSKYCADPLPELGSDQIPTQRISCRPPSTTSVSGARNIESGVTLAAPVPKTFAATSETVLSTLASVGNKPLLAQTSLPIFQHLEQNSVEEFPSEPLQIQPCPSVPSTISQSQLHATKHSINPPVHQYMHSLRSSSHVQERSIESTCGNTTTAKSCFIDSHEHERKEHDTVSSSSKKSNVNSGSVRPISPATMIALTEPILMSWCFDDAAIQRLLRAAGCE